MAEKGGEREQVRLQKQALRQDCLRQTETEDARISRLQGQAQRQQCMRDNIITSETAENRLKRLQNEARRKKASRAMSPVISQDSSDSDVVMEDVDSSSSDESSDESMNDNIQMTSDTSKAIQNYQACLMINLRSTRRWNQH